MEIKSKNKMVNVKFGAFVKVYTTEDAGTYRFLVSKGEYIVDDKGNIVDGIEPDKYYTIYGKGLNKNTLINRYDGERVTVTGKMYLPSCIHVDVDNNGKRYLSIVVL